MPEISNSANGPYLSAALSKKLQAARASLGDKLCTHPTSRFKPTKLTLLDEWLAMRRATALSAPPPAIANQIVAALGKARAI